MNKNKKIVYFFIASLFLCGSFFMFNNFISANNANHIIISEIQVGEESVYDEFIELYNPTNSDIDLESWDIKRKTKSGTESNILNNIEGVISAHGYFLIIPRANCGDNNSEKCYTGAVAADDEYTTDSFLADDNTILLYDQNGNLIDKVGWGEASDFESEVIINNPENKQSLERININGVIQDTDHNKNNFILQSSPNPQNSSFVNNDNSQEIEDPESSEDLGSEDNQGTEDENYNEDEQEQEGSTALRDNGANDNDKIIITEFLPDPEDSDKDNEFIEIHNEGNAEVDLSGWILEDKMGAVKKFIIPNGVKIGAGKYKTFYSDETKITLNNSGDGVILKNSKGDLADETEISGVALEEWAFTLDENKKWVWTKRPTPGRENVIEAEEVESNSDDDEISPSPFAKEGFDDGSYDFSDKIIISEIYPNSKGTDNRNGSYEWIELYNNSDRDVNLTGWMVDDILEKGSKVYIIENEIIKAGSYKIFDAASTKIALNNTGDEVNLLWPDGVVVNKIKYEKADEGLSYNLSNNGDWFWSAVITPEEENRISNLLGNNAPDYSDYYLDEEYFEDEEFGGGENLNLDFVEASLKDIEHFTKYTRIKIKGIVSTPPGIFSDQTFYISGSGIQVYSYEAEIPNLNIGDEVEIIGEISEIGGEKRILIERSEDIKIISSDNLVKPKIISTGSVNESVEGYLITIEGRVSQIKSDVFFLDDGNGEVKIYLKPQARIKRPEIKIGDWMVITGQVSQTSAGYRILPRFQGDLRLSKVTGVAQAADMFANQENVENNKIENKSSSSIFYGIIIIIGIFILMDWGRIRINRNK